MRRSLIVILLLTNAVVSLSQTYQENLEKYWYYRNRLKNEWMYNSQDNENGDNMVPENISIYEPCLDPNVVPPWNYLRYGDQTWVLGHYMGVLATEYHLLKNNGQDVTQVLLDINYALEALERLDQHGEECYIGGSPADNGFFIRDDVPSELSSQFPSFGQILSDYDDICDGTNTSGNEMSQDQVWGLFIGLRLLEKFAHVEDYNIEYRIRNNTDQIVNRMHFTNDLGFQEWIIKNPVTNVSVSAGADCKILSWGFGKIATDITGVNQQTSLSLYWKPAFEAAQASVLNQFPISPPSCFDSKQSSGDYRENRSPYNAYGILTLTSLSDHIGGTNFADAYQFLQWVNIETRKDGGYYNMEKGLYPHLIALNKAIHGNIVPNIGADFYEYFLNSAPPCGAYHYRDINGNHINSAPPWHTISLASPQHCLATDNVNRGHTNMIDYMLLYNLYFINYLEDDNSYLEIGEELTGKNIGKVSSISQNLNQVITASRQIDIYSTIMPIANVSLIAGEKIRFLPGFNAHNGSHVNAYIDQSLLEDIYYSEAENDPCNGQTSICDKSYRQADNISVEKKITDFLNLHEQSDISIYPNPTQRILNIDGLGYEIDEIIIQSIEGKNVFYEKNKVPQLAINLENLTNGIYIITVNYNNSIYKSKFFKK